MALIPPEFPQITTPPQANAQVLVNALGSAVGHALVYAYAYQTTSGLTFGYYGGRWGGHEIVAGTFTLTADDDNYYVVEIATGIPTCSTSTTDWNDGANYARVYKLTTGASAVTSAEDHRGGPGGVHYGGGAGVSTGGGVTGLEYTSSSTTTDSDPGTGKLRWNNSTQASATILYVDNADNDATSLATLWAGLPIGTLFTITQADDPDIWQLWKLNAAQTNGTGYYKFPVTLITQEGSNIPTSTDILLDVDAGAASFTGGTMTSAINEAPAVTVASSTTPAIFAAAGNTIDMTGTTTVTGFDTIAAGAMRWVIFAGVLQLTHHATSMINITGANITTAAGDAALFISLGSGNTRMVAYQRKSGQPLAGSAIGRHSIPIMCGSMRPSNVGGCAPHAVVASGSGLPDIVTLDFDPTTQEYAQCSVPMPKGWDEGTVTFKPIWSHPATTTNFGVVWDLQAVAVSDDDTVGGSFGTAQTSTDTGGTTNDLYTGPESSAITVGGSPAAEDVVFFRLSRVTGNGSDTMAVDARLHGIVLYINTDAGNDA